MVGYKNTSAPYLMIARLSPAPQIARCDYYIWNYCMLEIRGAYSENEKTGTLKVLAQFDNGILHVWHQSDPFYLLLSCSDFSITASRTDKTGCIRLNTGGCIETNDIEHLELIKQKLKETDQGITRNVLGSHELILMLSLLFLFFVVWIVAQNCG